MITTLPIPRPLRAGLISVGFREDLLRPDFTVPESAKRVALLAFADQPFDSRTACIAVVSGNDFADADLAGLRPSGAPLVFQCHPDSILVWSQGSDRPRFLYRLTPPDLPRFFREHRDELSPQAIYRAKLWGRIDHSYQLSFVDAGLMPLVEEEAGKKLTDLMGRVVKSTKHQLGWTDDISDADGRWLLQSTFWLLAAKILQDKAVPGFIRLDLTDVAAVYARLASHYDSKHPQPVPVRNRVRLDALVQAAERIRRFGHCGCVSTEALAYLYESALIDRETRRRLGTHSTPPWLVDYIVGRLRPWIEELDVDKRRVFEPACGHAAFLISAMRTLSELLPADWPESRQGYLRRRLHGVELDAFALEIARLSLTLADIPNPNGWALAAGDMFQNERLAQGVRNATIVLGNPPFERFDAGEGQADWLTNKAAETFRRVVDNLAPGAMFGFVLPQTFLRSRQGTSVRESLLRGFEIAEISLFADKVFRHGEPEIAVLIGRRRETGNAFRVRTRYQRVGKNQIGSFARSYVPSSTAWVDLTDAQGSSLHWPELHDLWSHLAVHPTLEDMALVGQGFFHKGDDDPSLPAGVVKVSSEFVPGLTPGFSGWTEDQLTHRLPVLTWLNLAPETIDREVLGTAQGIPQLLMNYGRVSREAWRLKTLLDEEGHPVTSRFIVVRPAGSPTPLRTLWAICNSPVANAYASCMSEKRDVLAGDMRRLPVPDLQRSDCTVLEQAVRDYFDAARLLPVSDGPAPQASAQRRRISSRQRQLPFSEIPPSSTPNGATLLERLKHLHWRVDAEVLRLYALPAPLERQLLDLFTGVRRRGVPFEQTEYFPRDFTELNRLSELLAITADWPRTNRRRAKLMDLEEAGRLTESQTEELNELQRLADARVSYFKPVFLEDADQIIEDLKRRGLWSEAT